MCWKEQELWRFSAYEAEEGFLDPMLLCEDGWLTAEELAEEEDLHALLRKAARRGFFAETGSDDPAEETARWLKESDTHRVWNDLVDEDTHLRAPPRALAA